MKIGPVDTEIALLRVKKEEITEGKIYSPVGKFAERAKQQQQQHQQLQQRLSHSSFTLGSKQELQLVVEGAAVSMYTKNNSKTFQTLTANDG